ncbi:hypothetical protein CRENBAI_010148 [Crenichthys baileyi]|uniref:Peptidase C80 domain-containing protein n=1 Tax=Crenichthys baileyi TaxID=28760 RepID=A0AAV9RRT4_9TELE
MAGRRQRWKPLQLLMIFSLLILTNQFEMRDVQEKLSRDVAAELHLRGTSHAETQELLKISESRVHLLKASMVHGPKESNQESHIYEEMDEPDPVSSSRTPQRPDDPILEFDHQQILMLEDDEVVRTSAASLYEKHPAVSSVHVVGPQLRVQQVKGRPVVLSEHSNLVLVGHGARDHSGETRISGYTYKDVARIIQSTSRISEKIQTTTVVACDIGSDQWFREALLKKLHEAGIETELHLWNTVVQVTETGEVISQDVSADGPQWRSGDQTKKVVLTVGRNGEIRRRKESDQRGQEVFTNDKNVLQTSKPTPDPRFQKYRSSWPQQPRRSVPLKVFNNISDQLKQHFKELEGLSWGLFHSDQPKPDKVDVLTLNIKTLLLGKKIKMEKMNWFERREGSERTTSKMFMRSNQEKTSENIIRHFAKDGEDETTYLMVNSWIYEVDPQSLYVYPVGKKRNHDPKTRPSVDQLKQSIEVQMGKADYPSVISESARNFRTFPLILMALDMTEKKKNMKDGLTFLFDDHSMTRGGSWIDPSRRGFTGSATPEGSSKLENKGQNKKTKEELLDDLKNIIYREDVMFTKWKQTIGGDQSYVTYVDQMAKIAEHYKVLIDPSSKQTFKKDCKNFKMQSMEKKILNNQKPLVHRMGSLNI